VAELLVWPALLAYGEAAVAYAGNARNPGALGRLATWGVRIGWLAQTALLAGQAYRADSFPWSTWAGSLNLFVWLVVGAYLIWGCSPRFRLLGLAVMPFAPRCSPSPTSPAAPARRRNRLERRPARHSCGLRPDRLRGFTVAAGLAALEPGRSGCSSVTAPASSGFACPRSSCSTASRLRRLRSRSGP
jgi:hypothetical protein